MIFPSPLAKRPGILRTASRMTMNAFETLGIGPRLAISDEAVRDAFREAGKLSHPDAGGAPDSFAKLREALDIVASPSRRLRHWLELRGITIDSRGVVAASVMDLFAEIGEVSQRAETLIRRREEAKSALGRALLESETQSCREAVEHAITIIESAIGRETARFPDYENDATAEIEAAAVSVRNLTFLEKWRLTLRGLYSRLV
jgi:curved DNA-binding protein CbpA